jgi:predicted dehydrogenase
MAAYLFSIHREYTQMKKGNLSRRGFLQRSMAAMAATGLPAWYASEVLAEAEEKAAKTSRVAANDKIIMGAIGIGSPQSRGRDIFNEARRQKGVEYVAACDVDGRHLQRGAHMIGPDCAKFKDFRELLDRKDINAVTIAVPDHWHALIAIDALRKGKDVYCEKPLTLTIAEGKALVKVAQQTGRVFQVGSQQRSDRRFRLACELVRNGRLGKIATVETRIGANPTCQPIPLADVPKELDWDFWLGPAPKADYVERRDADRRLVNCRHPYEFRWFYDYSGGKMTDWGAHHNDIAQWGLGMDGSGPVAIEASGASPSKGPNSYNCHLTFKVTYTYGNGARLICSHTQLPGSPDPKESKVSGRNGRERTERHDNGVLFVGDGGQWIFVNRGTITASDPKLLEEPLPSNATPLYHSDDHMGNFIDCVRSRKQTICPAEVGHRSVSVCHLGVIALRSGKKLKWDPVQEHFVGDKEANRWLRREMRAPWKLEV